MGPFASVAGAPTLACVNLRPYHGLNRARPASASQFFVTQSTLSYQPGQNVSVEIATHSNERYFRGFMIQAYDPISGAQQGHFSAQDHIRPIDSCSAATHRDNLNKKHVTLTWVPPSKSAGSASAIIPPVSSSWLGLRPLVSLNVNTGDQQRQPTDASHNASSPTDTASRSGHGLRQVRFRVTIVVTYEEFYIGFESSEQSFERFDYAANNERNAETN